MHRSDPLGVYVPTDRLGVDVQNGGAEPNTPPPTHVDPTMDDWVVVGNPPVVKKPVVEKPFKGLSQDELSQLLSTEKGYARGAINEALGMLMKNNSHQIVGRLTTNVRELSPKEFNKLRQKALESLQTSLEQIPDPIIAKIGAKIFSNTAQKGDLIEALATIKST